MGRLFSYKFAQPQDQREHGPIMFHVLFVCMGNICRSPMARAIASQKARERRIGELFFFDSAGSNAVPGRVAMDSRAKAVLERSGYTVPRHRSRHLVEKDFLRFDLLLALDGPVATQLMRRAPPEHAHKVGLLLDYAPGLEGQDVPDPYYGTPEGFGKVFELCEAGVRGLLDAPFKYDKR